MQWHTLLALKGQHSSDFLYIFGKMFIYKPVVFEIIVVFSNPYLFSKGKETEGMGKRLK